MRRIWISNFVAVYGWDKGKGGPKYFWEGDMPIIGHAQCPFAAPLTSWNTRRGIERCNSISIKNIKLYRFYSQIFITFFLLFKVNFLSIAFQYIGQLYGPKKLVGQLFFVGNGQFFCFCFFLRHIPRETLGRTEIKKPKKQSRTVQARWLSPWNPSLNYLEISFHKCDKNILIYVDKNFESSFFFCNR